jgi:hypothetical protein
MNTLAHTIALNSPDEANSILIKHGYPASQNTAELEYYLDDFMVSDPSMAGQELVNIHPDREFFEDFMAPVAVESKSNCGGGGHSNCSGCGGKCGQKTSAADGSGNGMQSHPMLTAQNLASSNMMIGIVAVLTLGIFGMVIATRR